MECFKESFKELQKHKNYGERHIDFDQFKKLVEWCKENFIGIKTINNKVSSSYGLKHIFEELPNGFYIKNADFKLAMKVAGFKSENKRFINEIDDIADETVNQYYAISSKSPAIIKK